MTRAFSPHDYQRDAMRHLHANPRAALWMPMGGGKTVATLTALNDLSLVEDVFPALVLAPLRVARTVWGPETQKWAHLNHLRVSVVTGSVKERRAALVDPADIVCMNYDNLVWLVEYYGKDWPFGTVVADESTRLKSFRLRQGSKRAGALGRVAHSKTNRFIELTGTPSPNGLEDLWGQAWFLDRGVRLGHSFSAFSDRWFQQGRDGYSLEPMPHAQREIEDKLRDICLTVTGLPVDEPIVNEIQVELPPAVREMYRGMEKDMFAQLAQDGVEAVNAAGRTNKLLQLCNGAIYLSEEAERGQWREVHDAKLGALESVIEEAAGAAILVAYNFKSDLARLLKAFPRGRVLDSNPQTVVDWNAGKIPLLFAHPACLHPDTEVLTEFRGWHRIVDVTPLDRVFDGVEFVRHSGCVFSGRKAVIDVFGVSMTPRHRILVDGVWLEGKDVGSGEDAKRKARYTYTGNDRYIGEMFALPSIVKNPSAELQKTQSRKKKTLPEVSARDISPPYWKPDLELLAWSALPGAGHFRQKLRRTRDRCLRVLVGFQNLLRGYGSDISDGFDDRTHRRKRVVLERELQVGVEIRSASQQADDKTASISGSADTSSCALSNNRIEPLCHIGAPRDGLERGPSRSCGESVHLQEEPKKANVYDLVDCGPRHRFVVRNSRGESFVAHNSAGHGLNLAEGGNILVFFGVNWNLEEHQQIIERIGPMRQKQAGLDRPVFVHLILARATVDYMVLDRLRSKRSVQDILLEAMKRRPT